MWLLHAAYDRGMSVIFVYVYKAYSQIGFVHCFYIGVFYQTAFTFYASTVLATGFQKPTNSVLVRQFSFCPSLQKLQKIIN